MVSLPTILDETLNDVETSDTDYLLFASVLDFDHVISKGLSKTPTLQY